MLIRTARPEEGEELLEVARAAFPDEDVASLVAELLVDADLVAELNLVAEVDGSILGHIMFTLVTVAGVRGVLLSPLGVVPEAQRSGIGSALVEAGLARARELGYGFALVLGHPSYYPRFGFEPAMPRGIEAPHAIDPPEAWMVAELVPGSLSGAVGVAEVAEAFADEAMWRE